MSYTIAVTLGADKNKTYYGPYKAQTAAENVLKQKGWAFNPETDKWTLLSGKSELVAEVLVKSGVEYRKQGKLPQITIE